MYNHMVVHRAADATSGTEVPWRQLGDDEVDRIFQALADSTRRDILSRTLTEPLSVSVLADDYDMSFAAVQKHVSVLESAGLVKKNKKGRERLVSGDPETVRKAQQLLDRYEQLWRQRIGRLDALLSDESGPEPDSPIGKA
ncbi:transcriptional regulator [Citricoccus zhacaiensis]|uniref:Transcriptional regulator n=2 Tax=Citricoccus zhacaiensis TaxID=489142 RepID=A0ABQ2LZ01_9MICC|nr:transcriptional regulator [Citricoccus zhacaiensis]